MIFYTLDYTIEKTLKQNLNAEQKFLKNFTKEEFSAKDAKFIYSKISDHKWYISEKLKRDVGMTVAAVDYFENFHEAKTKNSRSEKFYNSTKQVFENLSLSA
ncbi:MAG TPA: DUF4032 domain-containing protein [Pyrinomonadaceae bacterium]|nr:DUF4032 domain-containing protein [Pyrinomonadaceae bacterium]